MGGGMDMFGGGEYRSLTDAESSWLCKNAAPVVVFFGGRVGGR